MEMAEIEANITITATYDDAINITVQDKASATRFLEMTMTREQWVNASMNRLGCTNVEKVKVHNLDRVGKTMEMNDLTFEMPDKFPDCHNDKIAQERAKQACPTGWTTDLSFSSQGSFFTKDGKSFARTTIRRWV